VSCLPALLVKEEPLHERDLIHFSARVAGKRSERGVLVLGLVPTNPPTDPNAARCASTPL
jgi:hypothetical protein